jgi:hypothetical protein
VNPSTHPSSCQQSLHRRAACPTYARARETCRGGYFCIQDGRPYLGDVRGLGLMLGIECVSDAATLSPAPKLACWLRVRSRPCKPAGRQGPAACDLGGPCWWHWRMSVKLRLLAPTLQERMKAQRVLLTTDGAHCDNILKIKPPLVFSCRDADRLVAVLEVRVFRVLSRMSLTCTRTRVLGMFALRGRLCGKCNSLVKHRRRWRSLLAWMQHSRQHCWSLGGCQAAQLSMLSVLRATCL